MENIYILVLFFITLLFYNIYYADNNRLIKIYKKPFIFNNFNYKYYHFYNRIFTIFNSSSKCISLLDKFKISNNDSFLDVGSGNAYNLLYVNNKYKFKSIYGVDIDKNIYKSAKYNLSLIKSKKIINHNIDIINYKIPSDVTYIYLFNPFAKQFYSKKIDNDELDKYKQLIKNIKLSYKKNPRKITIIFVNVKPGSDKEEDIFKLFSNNFELYEYNDISLNILLSTKYAIFTLN